MDVLSVRVGFQEKQSGSETYRFRCFPAIFAGLSKSAIPAEMRTCVLGLSLLFSLSFSGSLAANCGGSNEGDPGALQQVLSAVRAEEDRVVAASLRATDVSVDPERLNQSISSEVWSLYDLSVWRSISSQVFGFRASSETESVPQQVLALGHHVLSEHLQLMAEVIEEARRSSVGQLLLLRIVYSESGTESSESDLQTLNMTVNGDLTKAQLIRFLKETGLTFAQILDVSAFDFRESQIEPISLQDLSQVRDWQSAIRSLENSGESPLGFSFHYFKVFRPEESLYPVSFHWGRNAS